MRTLAPTDDFGKELADPFAAPSRPRPGTGIARIPALTMRG
jgi:hypothetical protein